MKLTQLTAKPQLIKIQVDDEETVKEFGEPIEFWIWDRQPMHKFVKMANLKENDIESLVQVVREMVLDEEGKETLTEEVALPMNVLTKVIGKVVETLGK
jgi:hypothetical protein